MTLNHENKLRLWKWRLTNMHEKFKQEKKGKKIKRISFLAVTIYLIIYRTCLYTASHWKSCHCKNVVLNGVDADSMMVACIWLMWIYSYLKLWLECGLCGFLLNFNNILFRLFVAFVDLYKLLFFKWTCDMVLMWI